MSDLDLTEIARTVALAIYGDIRSDVGINAAARLVMPTLTAAAPLIAAQATAPAPCVMKHQAPYDFAWCETHDSTFTLGGRCKFYGREPWAVYAEEADEQRGLKVRAETELTDLREGLKALRDEWRTEADAAVKDGNYPAHSDADIAALDALIGGAK